ncbi:MAG: hypothetical protein A2X86_02940 [Bdellovibrionales bacterium GWA2_49_15]|nr:MAG: hypothetical protein A2X86_02940 [Bdellovibrionales bacterium GWA2_49_15]HAZ14104.1 hypothetical protein [Bdellovibrionales bacterium]
MRKEFEMKKTFIIPNKTMILSIAFLLVGILASVFGFYQNPERTWGNFLVCNYYFLSLAIGAAFFSAIQNITQSGWSAMFKRVPEAITAYLPYAAVLIILMTIFGSHSLYHWSHESAVQNDLLLQHKAPYLNIPFFIIRTVVFLVSWLLLTFLLRKFSLKEDREGGLENFIKSEFYSKVLIFVLALTFSLATFDWIMSIDSHWFSTIFAIKNFVSAFLHASAAIVIIVSILYKRGFFPQLNDSHLQDFSKYLFMLAMIWGYMWFSQFFLMWFSNIPEETVYYSVRMNSEWKALFFTDLFLNWTFPFLFLLYGKISKNMSALILTSVILLGGFWLDIYIQVVPGLSGVPSFGVIEAGMFVGFLGVFIFAVAKALSKASIIPHNHPYINESIAHELH